MKKLLLIPILASFLAFNSCNTQKNLTENFEKSEQEIKIDNKKHLEETIRDFNGTDTLIFKNYLYSIELHRDGNGKKSIWKKQIITDTELARQVAGLTPEQAKQAKKFDYAFAQKMVHRHNVLESAPNSLDSLIKKIISNKRLFSYNLQEFYNIKIETYLEKDKFDEAIEYLKQTQKVIEQISPEQEIEKRLLERYFNYLNDEQNKIWELKKAKHRQEYGIYKSYNSKGYSVIVVVTKYVRTSSSNLGQEYKAIVETDKCLKDYIRKNYGISIKKVVSKERPKIEAIDGKYNKAIKRYTRVKNKKLTIQLLKDLEFYNPYKE